MVPDDEPPPCFARSPLAIFFAEWRRGSSACLDVPKRMAQTEAPERHSHKRRESHRWGHGQDSDGDLARRKVSCGREAGCDSQPRLSRHKWNRSEERRVGKECRSRWSTESRENK